MSLSYADVVLQLSGGRGYYSALTTEATEKQSKADRLLEITEFLPFVGKELRRPLAYFLPGYGRLLSLFLKFFSPPSYMPLLVFHAVVDSVCCLLLYWLLRLSGNRVAAIVAAALYAIALPVAIWLHLRFGMLSLFSFPPFVLPPITTHFK